MNNLDKFVFTQKIILYILPILAMISIIMTLVLGKTNLALLGSYLVIPMVLAPILYILLHKNTEKFFSNNENIISNPNKTYFESHLFVLLLILYVLGFSISIIILAIFDVRPFAYYGIITSMATFILLEILLFEISNRKVIVILLQIVLLALNLVWGVSLKYYYFFGRTDPFLHAWYIFNLLKDKYVTDIFFQYQYFPLWHLTVASADLLFNINLSIHKMMYFINGFNFAVMIIVIYLLTSKLFKDKRIALISALFASINTDMIIGGMHSIPRSTVSFFEVLIILLILSSDIRKNFLIIFLSLLIIIYHTVSMPFVLIILFIIYILHKLFGCVAPVFLDWKYFLLLISSMFANYIYNAQNVFQILISNFVKPEVTGDVVKSIIYTPMNELFNYLQYSLLLLFFIFGTLVVLKSEKFSGFEKIFCLTGYLLIGVTFPGPALLSQKLAGNFNIGRFGEYAMIFFVIVGAIGFKGLFHGAGRKLKIIITMLFIFMTLLSISNDFSASDNPLIKREFYTFYLNEEETIAINHIAGTTSGIVMSDYATKRYLQASAYKNKTNLIEIDLEDRILKNSSNDNILIRDEDLTKRKLRYYPSVSGKFKLNPGEKFFDYYCCTNILQNNLKKYNKIYNSGGVSAYN